MDSASPKPYSWFSRFVSSLSWLLPASTLNPSNQSSNADQQNHPQTEGPESSVSHPQLPLSIFDSPSSSTPETFSRIQDDGNSTESAPPSPTYSIDSSVPPDYQMKTTTPLDLQYSPTVESASSSFDSFSTQNSSRDGVNISPPQPSTMATDQSANPKISTLVGLDSSPPQAPTAIKQNPNPKISIKFENSQPNDVRVSISNNEEQEADAAHPVLQIIDKQELGKHVLVLAIPMVMALVTTSNPLSKTLEMQVVAVALCCAFAAIWNGILLRKSHQTTSKLLLFGGISSMTLAFYAFVGCFLPLELKWIPGFCWLASLFPWAKVLLAFFRPEKVVEKENDLEKGDD